MLENGKIQRWNEKWIAEGRLKKCQASAPIEALDMKKLLSAFTFISIAFGLSFLILIFEIGIKNYYVHY